MTETVALPFAMRMDELAFITHTETHRAADKRPAPGQRCEWLTAFPSHRSVTQGVGTWIEDFGMGVSASGFNVRAGGFIPTDPRHTWWRPAPADAADTYRQEFKR